MMTTKSFLQKIAEVQATVSLKFDSKNPHFKNKYLSLSGTIAAVTPELHKRGLVMTQEPTVVGGQFGIQTTIREQVLPRDEDGGFDIDPRFEPFFTQGFWPVNIGNDPQKTAGATTYARRYSILACLGLCAEDDDAESFHGRPSGEGAELLAKLRGGR